MAEFQAAKSALRAEIVTRFQELPNRAKALQENHLLGSLNEWFEGLGWRSDLILYAYWPALPEEPNFQPWLEELIQQGVMIAMPRMNWREGILRFHLVGSIEADLETTKSGVIQPRKSCPLVDSSFPAAVLVPGLAFDRFGGRLGRGAGFYDRTLAEIPREIPRWAVAFHQQVVPEVPMAEWDQRVDGLILPSGLELL